MLVWVIFEDLKKSNAPEWYKNTEWYTGQRLKAAIEANGHTPFLLSAQRMGVRYNDGATEFYVKDENGTHELSMPDCVIPRTGSDTSPSTFAIYEALERKGVPVINNTDSIRLTGSKISSAIALKEANFPFPDFIIAGQYTEAKQVVSQLGLPVVAKIPCSNGGKGVSLLDNEADIQKAIANSAENGIFFQRYVAESHGRDFRLIVVGNEVVASVERRSTTSDFRSNVSLGGGSRIIRPSQAMTELALESTRHLGLEISGVDILDGSKGPVLCELNSAPGTPIENIEEKEGIMMYRRKVDYVLSKLKL